MRRLLPLLLFVVVFLQPYTASAATLKGSGLVRFLDGNALSDRVQIDLSGATPAPNGSHYQGWLGSDDGSRWLDVGTIALNSKGNGTIQWIAPDGQNLIGAYSRFNVTVEADNAAATSPSTEVAYQGAVAADVLVPWRALLVGGPDTPLPSRPGLASQFKVEADDLYDDSRDARNAIRDRQRSRTRTIDEEMLNRIVGINDGAWSDWDGDGKIEYTSDTYGILRYATTIRGVVGSLATNQSIPENSRARASAIVTTTNRIIDQVGQIRNLINLITPNVNLDDGLVVQRDVVWLARLASDGYDFNLDGSVDRNDGEGGASGIYRAAQDMGRIRLNPAK